jgi:DNA mismatch repair protein MutS
MSFYQFYFTEQQKYAQLYGEKTIVFMQNGKFYEAYCTKDRGYTRLEELEPLLNIRFIKRTDRTSDTERPSQFGIPCVSISRNLAALIEHGYTIVLFDQTSSGRDIQRVCVGVYSPGTYLSEKSGQDVQYIVTVYLVEEPQLGGGSLLACGVGILDVTRGSNLVHEFYSYRYDERFALDELVRVFQTFCPVELIFYFYPHGGSQWTLENVSSYLELNKYPNRHVYQYQGGQGPDGLDLLREEYFKIVYQNDFLAEKFDLMGRLGISRRTGLGGNTSPLEILGLERRPYALIALIILVKYLEKNNALLVQNLRPPSIYLYEQHLILGNNAIEQLNIVDSAGLEVYDARTRSVFDVVNRTSTPMGRRFLREALLNPLSRLQHTKIEARYQMVHTLKSLPEGTLDQIREELRKIHDMERLHRRMALGIITPYEFYRLDTFYDASKNLLGLLQNINMQLLSEKCMQEFCAYYEEYHQVFRLEVLADYHNFTEVQRSPFQKGVCPRIDRIERRINRIFRSLEQLKSYLNGLLGELGDRELIVLENNERDGYHFTVPRSREALLRKNLDAQYVGLVFRGQKKGRTKIFVEEVVGDTTSLSRLVSHLAKLVRREFVQKMLSYYAQHQEMLHQITLFIAELDFLVSGALVAQEYHYCRPKLDMEHSGSYLVVQGLRHAIVERLCRESEYIPNDVQLGNLPGRDDAHGMIIFSVNGAGKSVLMKSIGVAIILAQIGYYVPAESFVYSPYMALYARITGNDNIFKGLSSFALEMVELEAILTRVGQQGEHTLVIGDEICRGTENVSGMAIVASALVELSQQKASFIFSSHLHKLVRLPEIKALKNLRVFHLKVGYNLEKKCLVFERKLSPGPGPSVYGLIVARYILRNPRVIGRAESIKRRLLHEDEPPIKMSNYNSKLLMKRCTICHYTPYKEHHKELESHHINFQCDTLLDGKIKKKPYLKKNEIYNLVVLCRRCHVMVHQKYIKIYGYQDTTLGPLLNYRIDLPAQIKMGLQELDTIEKS